MACRPRPCRSLSRTALATSILAAAALVGIRVHPISAGPNAGGTLILHVNTSLAYTDENEGYCGQSGLTSCDQAVTSVSGTEPVVFFAIAAFPEGSSPRLMGLTFGVEYDDEVFTLLDWGSCGDFELPNEEWPAPGAGTAVTWGVAQVGSLVEVYWFAGYAYSPSNPTTFGMTGHPTQGADFADDDVPSVLDAIAGFGRLGFSESGVRPCSRLGRWRFAGRTYGLPRQPSTPPRSTPKVSFQREA